MKILPGTTCTRGQNRRNRLLAAVMRLLAAKEIILGERNRLWHVRCMTWVKKWARHIPRRSGGKNHRPEGGLGLITTVDAPCSGSTSFRASCSTRAPNSSMRIIIIINNNNDCRRDTWYATSPAGGTSNARVIYVPVQYRYT